MSTSSRGAADSGEPTPLQSPGHILALHDLLGQDTPSTHTYPGDGPSSSSPETTAADCGVKPSPSPQPVRSTTLQKADAATAAPSVTSAPAISETPPPEDWLAIRAQVTPTRHIGAKGEWIRGWSVAVSTCGDEAYCACSESCLSSRKPGVSAAKGRKSREGWRSALSSSLDLGTRTSSDLCAHCNRRPSPPRAREDEAGSEKTTSIPADKTLSLRHKLSRCLRLFRAGWKEQPDLIEQKRQTASSKCDPGRAVTKTLQQQDGRKQSGSDINIDELGSVSSGPEDGVSQGRLERAQKLLQKSRLAAMAAV